MAVYNFINLNYLIDLNKPLVKPVYLDKANAIQVEEESKFKIEDRRDVIAKQI